MTWSKSIFAKSDDKTTELLPPHTFDVINLEMSSLWDPEWYHLLLPPVLIVRLWLVDAVKLLALQPLPCLRWAFIEAPIIWRYSHYCLQTCGAAAWANRRSRNAHPSSYIKLPRTSHAINIFTLRCEFVYFTAFYQRCFYLVSLRYGMAVKYLALRGIMVHLNILLRRDWRKSQDGRYL